MPVEVIMPKVDMDMTHGTVATWHVAEGDAVTAGAPLFDIETDKAAMEVEAPATGRIGRITAAPGDRVAVGTTVAMIYAAGESIEAAPMPPDSPAVAARPLPPSAAERPVPPDRTEAAGSTLAASASGRAANDDDGIRATPAARALARGRGLDLADVLGTGPRGRIQRDDVAEHRAPRSEPAAERLPAASWTPGPGPLHVSRRPGRGTPLVLLHGFAADGQSWAPLEKAVDPGRPLIRIELPGHGRSPRRRIGGFGDLARMMVEAFDAATRGLGPVHLLGHSLGGAVALAVADLRARDLASLALIAPAGLGPEIDGATLQGIARASRSESLGPWLRRLTATPDGIGNDYVRAAMKQRIDPELRAFQTDMADALFPDGTQAFDLRPALSRLDRPAALIWGRRDAILPHRHAFAADGEVAIHLLKDAGHVPHIECPERIAAILRRHWAAAEAGLRSAFTGESC